MITNNTSPNGELDTDQFQRAGLQYLNSPDQQTKFSPVMLLFGRSIKDFVPILPGKYRPHRTWSGTHQDRELALRNRHMRTCERLSEHRTSEYNARIQNQTGPHPNKWDKTETIIKVKQFDQYLVRVTLRNREFLCQFTPVMLLKITIQPWSIQSPLPEYQNLYQSLTLQLHQCHYLLRQFRRLPSLVILLPTNALNSDASYHINITTYTSISSISIP